MKINDSVKNINGTPHMVKQYCWDDNEIQIELSAAEHECDLMCGDPRGDVIHNSYKPNEIKQALKDFFDVISKNYDEVDLSIYNFKNEQATFSITFYEKKIVVWSTADVTKTDENAEKLAKIAEIIKT